jgi:glycosyltransferase involved in cell wall biosynthesis
MPQVEATSLLTKANLPAISIGFLLHLGGSQWYKNLAGVLQIYTAYSNLAPNPMPLVCISPKPNTKIEALINNLPKNAKVIFRQGIDNQTLHAAYSMAAAFIFPSLAEGFGWPIVEAQACGCPVLTTAAAPMNEVGSTAATYIPVLNITDNPQTWAREAALKLIDLIKLPESKRDALTQAGITNAAKFDAKATIDGYLKIYEQILAGYFTQGQSNSNYQRAH